MPGQSETSSTSQPNNKMDTFLKLAEKLVMPLTLALVGFFVSQYLNDREQAETDFRFLTELMSRREESDSGLRKEMFNSVLTNFLKPAGKRPPEESILNLELLACNFDDSLDLAPLFKEVHSQISTGKLQRDEKVNLLARLDSVTKRAKDKQISTLEDSGAKLDGTLSFASLHEERGEVFEGGEVINGTFTPKLSGNELETPKGRRAKIEVLRLNRDLREVTVRMIVQGPSGSEADGVLKVGFFDFPMLNNVRLPGGNRCAIVLREFGKDSAEIVFVFFPGTRASLKDKPYFDELTNYLQSKRDSPRKK